MAAMTSGLKVFLLVFILMGFFSNSLGECQKMSDAVMNIFLKKKFNSTDSERILKSARESYFYLKKAEEEKDINKKFNFVKNYGNFLLKLFKEVQTNDFDIYELFMKENSFLKEYDQKQITNDFNVTELKTVIEDFQDTAKRQLMSYYNSSKGCFEPSKILALNETSFDLFLKEKIRADFSDVGYFFLEVFATLIGLSWGVISTVIHITQPNTENIP